MLSRAAKEQQVGELREKLARATSVFVVDYRGLDVAAQNELRARLRREGGGDFEYRVAKNTVLRRAVADSDAASLGEALAGPTAVAISYGDPVGLAKILVDYQKEHEVFALKAGVVEGEAVDEPRIATLATLPSLEALRGKIVGLLQAPATKLARVLQAPGGQIARLVTAREKKLAETDGSPS